MHPIIRTVLNSIHKVAPIALHAYENINEKSNAFNKKNEDYFINIENKLKYKLGALIKSSYNNHAVLGYDEETEAVADDVNIINKPSIAINEDYVWVIDAICGLKNFVHRVPNFSICIGMLYKNTMNYAVIYDLIRQEAYFAVKGYGSRFDNKRIRLNNVNINSRLLMAIDNSIMQTPYFNSLLNIGEFRISGCSALDFAHLSSGKLDLCCFAQVKRITANIISLIVNESGGSVFNFAGNNIDNIQYNLNNELVDEYNSQKIDLIAGNQSICSKIINLFSE